MHAYAYDSSGRYIGIVDCQIDRRETLNLKKDVWLLPAQATYQAPPEEVPEDCFVKWTGTGWALEKEVVNLVGGVVETVGNVLDTVLPGIVKKPKKK